MYVLDHTCIVVMEREKKTQYMNRNIHLLSPLSSLPFQSLLWQILHILTLHTSFFSMHIIFSAIYISPPPLFLISP